MIGGGRGLSPKKLRLKSSSPLNLTNEYREENVLTGCEFLLPTDCRASSTSPNSNKFSLLLSGGVLNGVLDPAVMASSMSS